MNSDSAELTRISYKMEYCAKLGPKTGVESNFRAVNSLVVLYKSGHTAFVNVGAKTTDGGHTNKKKSSTTLKYWWGFWVFAFFTKHFKCEISLYFSFGSLFIILRLLV